MKEIKAVELCSRIRTALKSSERTMQVHSVFASAVNMIGEDVFFSLLSDKSCLFPMSCRVSNEFLFTEYGIREGMEVIVTSDRILIPQVDLFINLKDAVERDLSFDKKEVLLLPKNLILHVELLKKLIEDKGCEQDLSTLVTGKYRNPYADLVKKKLPGLHKAIKKNTVQAGEQAGEQAAELAGCGIGLTPSSDDMLIGYMSAYLAYSKAKGYRLEEIYKVTNAMGNKAAERTNTISGAFLKQCGMGLFSEDMTKLMCVLFSDSRAETVRKFGQRILNFGSTSGIDMLTGIVLAIVNLTSTCYSDCEYQL